MKVALLYGLGALFFAVGAFIWWTTGRFEALVYAAMPAAAALYLAVVAQRRGQP